MTTYEISPELVLVDPQLRDLAVAGLPALEPFDFLARRDRQPAPNPAERRSFGEPIAATSFGSGPPLLVAAAVYTVAALGRVILMDSLAVLAIVLAISGIEVLS
jgi:hypothetical protein